ncbi:hypothetical protein ACKI16_46465, partial [Streptomyces scabiei]|uniref:hypothetical protein n=1 Tax=Streptomyces scabiei TaxID=1930 RepID=UPI0038F63CBC
AAESDQMTPRRQIHTKGATFIFFHLPSVRDQWQASRPVIHDGRSGQPLAILAFAWQVACVARTFGVTMTSQYPLNCHEMDNTPGCGIRF